MDEDQPTEPPPERSSSQRDEHDRRSFPQDEPERLATQRDRPERLAAQRAGSDRAAPTSDARIEIDDVSKALDHDALRWLRVHASDALRSLEVRGEVRARIVRDDEMADAHRRHLDIDGTTDVLTFDLREDDRGDLDVDLLLCVDEARRQADLRGHRPERELLLYLVHGVLHCLGHDDHDDEDARRMHDLEDRTLEAIGVGVTFERDPN